ncbi:Ger(x)C family spore germination protein [Gracilibacillus sp. YIM 98692]|uniref:Ger(x)C family spore germination protein n=1 Tax=Gracilibacillus sp. YIM 98692 TaxID=2663532 RepID=UPI0013D34C39|nr:Ger(x)C family spore germination protein [Gracilibacillus sp. YIM 98692]
MKRWLTIAILLFLTGCWSSKELVEYGFVMGISIDQTENEEIEFHAQIYSPAETIGGTSGGETPFYTNINSKGKSVFDSARNIPVYLGRKAQWSHMRVVLIGEDFAKKHNIGDVLEFFYRDHETRLMSYVLITNRKAADYWEMKPFIERTISQELRTILDSSANFTGKSKKSMLLNVAMDLKSKSKTTLIPYIKKTDNDSLAPVANGAAVVQEGKMVDYLDAADFEKIIMLKNEYKGGIINFPCMDKENDKLQETIEVAALETNLSPQFNQESLSIDITTKIDGFLGELQCSTVTTADEVEKLEKHIAKNIQDDMNQVIHYLQENELDVLGIADKLYQQKPQLWKKHEAEWGKMLAESEVDLEVEVKVESTGMAGGEKVVEE